MRFVIIAVIALAALAQATRNWSAIRPKDIHASTKVSPPFLPRIVGGDEAVPNSFPHQVALFIDDAAFCGGSLINKDVVLTAAHCIDGAKTIEVVAGAHNIRKEDETTQQRITSTDFVMHEDWDADTLINDIALVILPQEIKLDDTKKVIKLHEASCADSALDGREATISGWGRDSESADGISPVLRYTSEKILLNSICQLYYNNIQNTHICLSGNNLRGACNEDSGGAMIIEVSGNLEQVGVVSFGSDWGCEWGFPVAYTRVPCYTEWITSKISATPGQ